MGSRTEGQKALLKVCDLRSPSIDVSQVPPPSPPPQALFSGDHLSGVEEPDAHWRMNGRLYIFDEVRTAFFPVRFVPSSTPCRRCLPGTHAASFNPTKALPLSPLSPPSPPPASQTTRSSTGSLCRSRSSQSRSCWTTTGSTSSPATAAPRRCLTRPRGWRPSPIWWRGRRRRTRRARRRVCPRPRARGEQEPQPRGWPRLATQPPRQERQARGGLATSVFEFSHLLPPRWRLRPQQPPRVPRGLSSTETRVLQPDRVSPAPPHCQRPAIPTRARNGAPRAPPPHAPVETPERAHSTRHTFCLSPVPSGPPAAAARNARAHPHRPRSTAIPEPSCSPEPVRVLPAAAKCNCTPFPPTLGESRGRG
jgi:hypothetical protein